MYFPALKKTRRIRSCWPFSQTNGYQAAYAPDYLTIDKPDEIRIARKAFEKEGILIAEAGYWENMLDLRPDERRKNREEMCKIYAMAEELGAGCVVNTAGSYCEGPGYQNHNPQNFYRGTFLKTPWKWPGSSLTQ